MAFSQMDIHIIDKHDEDGEKANSHISVHQRLWICGSPYTNI